MPAGDAGDSLDAAALNSAAAQITRQVFTALSHVLQFKATLDGYSEADLVAKGVSAPGATDMKSAFGDLGKLALVFQGGDTVSVAQDFRVFARRLIGTGLY
jgi:hypothetical protein